MNTESAFQNLLTGLKKRLEVFQFKESITGLAECRTTFIPVAIFDLLNLQIADAGKRVELRSFNFGDSTDLTNPSIATVALEDSMGFHNTASFLKDMRGNVKHQRNKPCITVDEPAVLLPYYTTHFGHFSGDCLGAIIALSKAKLPSKRKLFYIAPNSFDHVITKYGNPERLQKIDSKLALENNLIFTNACQFPRMSSWQNLSLCTQIFGETKASLPADNTSFKKVFLTSGRSERIANIDEVIEFVKGEGFYICRPDQITFEQCLTILREADLVVSENGSITHNILIARNKPFYILSSKGWDQLSQEEFAGGGIYNAFKAYLTKYIECKTTGLPSHHHFSSQIIVDLGDIKNLL
ncbi:glycosyltransferase 61 family protein [Polynucleobacter sp. MG-28-Ekke-A2]|uniref:glycosyltransferase 61 family protein n=1 Tax=Polynucleobacter sp. MG-28-Ekke-A2 TaxID=3108276 RepID=UPI002B23278B|nr:glycosyltransferase 61 family protein [Polynucleobacter sp. MG-28-Ekke-A2]